MQAEIEEGAATSNMPKEPTSASNEEADEIEPDREPDIFDNAEEYVGVDDEAMYGTLPATTQFDNANFDSNSEPNAEIIHVEAEVNDADPLEVQVLHDPENPKIVKGERFPDIVAFRKAIRHSGLKLILVSRFTHLCWVEHQEGQRCKGQEVVWRKMPTKRK